MRRLSRTSIMFACFSVRSRAVGRYSPREVARNYLSTWFFLDLLSGIPFGMFDLKVTPRGDTRHGTRWSRVACLHVSFCLVIADN